MMRNPKSHDLEERKKLRETDIFQEYLILLRKLKKKLVVIAVKDTPGYELTEKMARQLKSLGISNNLSGQHWHGFIAVIKNGVVIYEKLGGLDEAIEKQMTIGSETQLYITSKPWNAGNDAEIVINGMDYAVKMRGVNIVVYDIQEQYLIDSVCFDTHDRRCSCSRKDRNMIEVWHTKQGIQANVLKDRLAIKNIIPNFVNTSCEDDQKNIKEKFEKNKVEVRLYYGGAALLWNTLRSIGMEFKKDQRCHVVVVLDYDGGRVKGKEAVVRNDGFEYVNSHEWDASEDVPDILISNGLIVPPEQRKYVRFWAIVPFFLIIGSMADTVRAVCDSSNIADCVLVEKFLYNQINRSSEKVSKTNIYELGSPKFDQIFETRCGEKKLPPLWKKIEGKKVVLWTTSHGWGVNINMVSFDLYIKSVIEYFRDKEDLALIIRPHFTYIQELLEHGIWSNEDYISIKNYIGQTTNIVWDDLDDYSLSYSLADAIITDVNCGITISALVLDKPLGIMTRYDGNYCEPFYPEVVAGLYKIESVEDCCDFFEMIVSDEDPMKEMRQKVCHQYISHFDGQNGKRIKDFITEKYSEKFGLPLHMRGGE